MTSPRAMLLVCAAVMVAAGCGDSRKGKKKVKSAADEGPATIEYKALGQCETDGLVVDDADLDSDGVTDVRSVFKTVVQDGMETIVMVCKETDLNFDGTKDLVQFLGEDGKPLRYEIDLDFDGKIDVVKYFAGGVQVRSEFDTNYDGNMDTWNVYENGNLKQSDRDRNGDGDIDESQYFDDEGALECLGYDTDGDNAVDHWERADTGLPIENPSPENPCNEQKVYEEDEDDTEETPEE